jgi:hypothetical protein
MKDYWMLLVSRWVTLSLVDIEWAKKFVRGLATDMRRCVQAESRYFFDGQAFWSRVSPSDLSGNRFECSTAVRTGREEEHWCRKVGAF